MKRVEVDTCGLICPRPILEAEKEFIKMSKGDELVIITDHELVSYNLMDWAEGKGYEPELIEIGQDSWRVIIVK
ncbi:MAG: sulfurtransferase TusA family protein [Bacillota bacterium]|nr:sulfurtransferase TusA family protein [Bacillota bacterium]